MTVLENKTIAGGAASNIAPNYVDGVMFSNDDEFYLYGFVASFSHQIAKTNFLSSNFAEE